jgi:hypothetical protein
MLQHPTKTLAGQVIVARDGRSTAPQQAGIAICTGEGNDAARVAWQNDVQPEGLEDDQRKMARTPTHVLARLASLA